MYEVRSPGRVSVQLLYVNPAYERSSCERAKKYHHRPLVLLIRRFRRRTAPPGVVVAKRVSGNLPATRSCSGSPHGRGGVGNAGEPVCCEERGAQLQRRRGAFDGRGRHLGEHAAAGAGAQAVCGWRFPCVDCGEGVR
jgi:hypothetical protein